MTCKLYNITTIDKETGKRVIVRLNITLDEALDYVDEHTLDGQEGFLILPKEEEEDEV